MKHPDENHEPLLRDILEDEPLSALRRESLDRGLAVMRRTRRVRGAIRAGTLALLPVLAIITLTLARQRVAQGTIGRPSSVAKRAAAPGGGPGVTLITDEELFALFPGRSLALIGKPGHQELLVLGGRGSNYK
jgi:hypothetical protein